MPRMLFLLLFTLLSTPRATAAQETINKIIRVRITQRLDTTTRQWHDYRYVQEQPVIGAFAPQYSQATKRTGPLERVVTFVYVMPNTSAASVVVVNASDSLPGGGTRPRYGSGPGATREVAERAARANLTSRHPSAAGPNVRIVSARTFPANESESLTNGPPSSWRRRTLVLIAYVRDDASNNPSDVAFEIVRNPEANTPVSPSWDTAWERWLIETLTEQRHSPSELVAIARTRLTERGVRFDAIRSHQFEQMLGQEMCLSVVEASVPRANGAPLKILGVGFGETGRDARNQAIARLGGRLWSYDAEKHENHEVYTNCSPFRVRTPMATQGIRG